MQRVQMHQNNLSSRDCAEDVILGQDELHSQQCLLFLAISQSQMQTFDEH